MTACRLTGAIRMGGGGKVKKGKRETSCKLRKDLPQLKEDFMEFKTCVPEI